MKDNIKDIKGKENTTKARIVEFAPEVNLKEDPEVAAEVKKNLKDYDKLVVENEKQTKNMMVFSLLSNLFSSIGVASTINISKKEKEDLVDSVVEYVDIFVEKTNFKL